MDRKDEYRESTEAGILRVLKEAHGWVPETVLSNTLGIEGPGVNRYISGLISLGYSISHYHGKGYKLDGCPNLPLGLEVEPLLDTSSFGRQFHFFDQVGSTNDVALQMGLEGCPEGTVVVADSQTRGRGRMGRSWASPRGLNLYFSLVLRPDAPPWKVPCLSLVAGTAVVEALDLVEPLLCPRIKWPNDIYAMDRKLAGILLETRSGPGKVHFVVAGIGINVNSTSKDLPEDIRQTAVSMKDITGKEYSRPEILAKVLKKLEVEYQEWKEKGFEGFIEKIERVSWLKGKEIRVKTPEGVIRGKALGISGSGSLVVRSREGKTHEILSGETEPVGE